MSRPKPTKSESNRIDRMLRLGCIITRLKFGTYSPAECHHIVDGYRLGHWWSLPLNPWYHRGVFDSRNASRVDMERVYGPSIAHGIPPFVDAHGKTEIELWQIIQGVLGLSAELPASKIIPRVA